jgi:hypothetical protein
VSHILNVTMLSIVMLSVVALENMVANTLIYYVERIVNVGKV